MKRRSKETETWALGRPLGRLSCSSPDRRRRAPKTGSGWPGGRPCAPGSWWRWRTRCLGCSPWRHWQSAPFELTSSFDCMSLKTLWRVFMTEIKQGDSDFFFKLLFWRTPPLVTADSDRENEHYLKKLKRIAAPRAVPVPGASPGFSAGAPHHRTSPSCASLHLRRSLSFQFIR